MTSKHVGLSASAELLVIMSACIVECNNVLPFVSVCLYVHHTVVLYLNKCLGYNLILVPPSSRGITLVL